MAHLTAVPTIARNPDDSGDVFAHVRSVSRVALAAQRRGLVRLAADHGVTVPLRHATSDRSRS